MNKQQILAQQRKKLIAANLSEYADTVGELNWVTGAGARDAEGVRGSLIAGYGDMVTWLFSQTKPSLGPISPGCRICGNGGWSCLFINGKCNCRCFYCPTAQDEISVPTTNHLPFSRAQDYSEYVNHFGFEGVSMSGGEPLLTADKTIEYIQTVRQKCGESIHIWMYTNGTLLTEEHVRKLKDVGLNEIRFDISAKDYDVEKLRLAVGRIPTVTVEIPAIPEDKETLLRMIPILQDVGVNHLNLHQLRLTPHNSRFLKSRGYTFLHGEKVTVLESELTALSILKEACDNRWALPINYCAFAYKNQFQRAASRKRNAAFIMKSHESVTESGLIRSITLTGPSQRIMANAETLAAQNPEKTLWQISGNKEQITIHPSLWSFLDKTDTCLSLTYSEAVLSPVLSYQNPFKEIRLDSGMKIYAEKRGRKHLNLDSDQMPLFEQRVIVTSHEPTPGADPEFLNEEFITPGLQDYF